MEALRRGPAEDQAPPGTPPSLPLPPSDCTSPARSA